MSERSRFFPSLSLRCRPGQLIGVSGVGRVEGWCGGLDEAIGRQTSNDPWNLCPSPLSAPISPARCLLASGLSKGPSTGGALEHGQRPRRVKDGIDGVGGRHGFATWVCLRWLQLGLRQGMDGRGGNKEPCERLVGERRGSSELLCPRLNTITVNGLLAVCKGAQRSKKQVYTVSTKHEQSGMIRITKLDGARRRCGWQLRLTIEFNHEVMDQNPVLRRRDALMEQGTPGTLPNAHKRESQGTMATPPAEQRWWRSLVGRSHVCLLQILIISSCTALIQTTHYGWECSGIQIAERPERTAESENQTPTLCCRWLRSPSGAAETSNRRTSFSLWPGAYPLATPDLTTISVPR